MLVKFRPESNIRATPVPCMCLEQSLDFHKRPPFTIYLEKPLGKFIRSHFNALYGALLVTTPNPELDVTAILRAPACGREQAMSLSGSPV